MNIVIIGPGAIGTLWATKLSISGHHVAVWSTSNKSHLNLQLGEQSAIRFDNQNIDSLKLADLLLVTVKAWQVEQALTPLKKHIAPETMIALMHNGMGTDEWLHSTFPDNPLLLATTTHGAYKPTQHRAIHTGAGITQIGGINHLGKQCHFLQEVMQHALPEVTWCDNIEHALWLKLAINCAINPLTATLHIRNGDLAAMQYKNQLTAIIQEVFQVMSASSIPIELPILESTVYQVINTTAENFSSMQQDIYYKRKSEIDFITGYLLKQAKIHNIQTPENQALYTQIKHIEQSWES
ncbi:MULTISPECIES: 2-dehydropantoate 2-reductase [Vibrio]|uniref:2-dehydropantoate 2-reductase n=1 Tax=Vibrio TaxID=662 RepID=UPI00207530B6|nr:MULTISPECIES: 2-dehydropantoate 2-reductase [Vibrio]USD31960.1 2-dehydropantoate 2-reductase [Vibrio sp. SCSIO 43186]USD45004.1 2-dehydropantoate 2-reductase [Vibrio sp. SCSIO 43145]USD69083.1 2-dehydropantoate 2-reductase [Vibrio sp. SCSIO 43139]USD96771.1 2-dehydropantoate 2-reductase [Vibrio coralliilyticus]